MTLSEGGTRNAGQRRVFAVTAGLFAIWGVALWLYNSLFFKFVHFFSFGPVPVAWTLAAFHIAYVCLVIPAVLFHRQFGFKLGFLAGLSVFAIGAFLLYLAIIQQSSLYFIGAVVVIGSCGAWLDTSLNPLAALAGNRDNIVTRMNIVHAFNGCGLFAAYVTGIALLGKDYQLSSGATAQFSARPYVLVGLGAILLAFLVEQIKLPDFASKGTEKPSKNVPALRAELRALQHDRNFVTAAVALAAYCAVLTILWTANYKYQHLELPGRIIPIFERGWFWFVIGRIAGTVLMRWIEPMRLVQVCAGLCMIAITAAATGGLPGWAALLSCSFFLAITYPTVFGTALSRQWSRLAAAAGLLAIAAGIGNALSSLGASFALDGLQMNPRLVVLAALPFEALILYYAVKARSRHTRAATTPAPSAA